MLGEEKEAARGGCSNEYRCQVIALSSSIAMSSIIVCSSLKSTPNFVQRARGVLETERFVSFEISHPVPDDKVLIILATRSVCYNTNKFVSPWISTAASIRTLFDETPSDMPETSNTSGIISIGSRRPENVLLGISFCCLEPVVSETHQFRAHGDPCHRV